LNCGRPLTRTPQLSGLVGRFHLVYPALLIGYPVCVYGWHRASLDPENAVLSGVPSEIKWIHNVFSTFGYYASAFPPINFAAELLALHLVNVAADEFDHWAATLDALTERETVEGHPTKRSVFVVVVVPALF
jgi:hypothetical protein